MDDLKYGKYNFIKLPKDSPIGDRLGGLVISEIGEPFSFQIVLPDSSKTLYFRNRWYSQNAWHGWGKIVIANV